MFSLHVPSSMTFDLAVQVLPLRNITFGLKSSGMKFPILRYPRYSQVQRGDEAVRSWAKRRDHDVTQSFCDTL